MVGCQTQRLGPKARHERPSPPREPDEDDFAVKDVFDYVPKRTSRSVRYAFENSGYSVRRFIKMPGRGFYCLQVRRKSATPCASVRQARRRVAEILETAGLRPGRDDLLVTQTVDGLAVGLAAAFDDVNQAAGFLEL
jgi:hypothetical protein